MPEIVLPHGNYQELESYQNSVIIFDATQDFCANFLKKGDRTIDQMIQAARSGKQNIIEGCMASGISSETEIKLIGVARASLEELVEDYRDFLRTHNLPLWGKEDPRILQIRQLAKQKNKTYETYKSYLSADNPELFCNTMISLIHQTNYLLDRQIKSLEKSFTEIIEKVSSTYECIIDEIFGVVLYDANVPGSQIIPCTANGRGTFFIARSLS